MALILVADDDPAVADAIKRELELRGHQVEIATDGVAMAEKAERSRPSLIVCDIHMPNLYGTGAYDVLQRDSRTSSIPVVFVTGLPLEKAQKLVPQSPKVRLLSKPLDPKALDEVLKALLPAKPPQ
jgi:CheY-like chemotaxis protein